MALGRLMSGVLFGVEPSDAPAMAAAIVTVGITALIASLAPLRHALRSARPRRCAPSDVVSRVAPVQAEH